MTALRAREIDPRQTVLDLGTGCVIRVHAPQPRPQADNDNATRARLAPVAKRMCKWAEPGSRIRQLGLFDWMEWRPHVSGRSYSVLQCLRAIGEDPTSGQQRKNLTEQIDVILRSCFETLWQQKGEEDATLWLFAAVSRAKTYRIPDWATEAFVEWREEIMREFYRPGVGFVLPDHDHGVEDRSMRAAEMAKQKAVSAWMGFVRRCRLARCAECGEAMRSEHWCHWTQAALRAMGSERE